MKFINDIVEKFQDFFSQPFVRTIERWVLLAATIIFVVASMVSLPAEYNSPSAFKIGYALLAAGIILGVSYFTLHFWPDFRPSNRDLAVIALILLASCLLFRINHVLAESLRYTFPGVDTKSFINLTPLAAGGMILQITLGPPSVFLFFMTYGFLTGTFLADSWALVLMIVLGNIVGAISVTHSPRRAEFIRAGLRVAGANSVILFCYLLIRPEITTGDAFAMIICAIVGGILSAIVAAGLMPVTEVLGGYVTQFKLLELASLDRPLLRDISLQAPGTWNHSLVMGQMGEVAAEAIGANGLLTRVGAYYHDVGKIKKPEYFVENQRSRENKHDKLPPSMSALIIKTHVKDGVEIAGEHRLPKQIMDFIPQHHGTSLIKFFYDKALKDTQEGEDVDENNYRYPGPKPQTKEAGILMLADAVEASCRTIADPTPAKIQGAVQKIINNVFTSGQLDESNLTLRDLHLIAKSFTRVLTGIHHRRVEYAEPVEKGLEKGREEESKSEKAPNENGASSEDKKETLKRLGM